MVTLRGRRLMWAALPMLVVVYTAGAQSTRFAVEVAPALEIPVSATDLLDLGGSLNLQASIPLLDAIAVNVDAGYSTLPTAFDAPLNVISGGAGATVGLGTGLYRLNLTGSGGYFYSTLDGAAQQLAGGGFYAGGGVGLEYFISPLVSVQTGGTVRWHLGSHTTAGVSLGASIHPGAEPAHSAAAAPAAEGVPTAIAFSGEIPAPSASGMSIDLAPAVDFPISHPALAPGPAVNAQASFPLLPPLRLNADFAYSNLPSSLAAPLHVVAAGGSATLDLGSELIRLRFNGGGSYFFSALDNDTIQVAGGNLYAGGGVELAYFVSPRVAIEAGGGVRWHNASHTSAIVSLGASIHPGADAPAPSAVALAGSEVSPAAFDVTPTVEIPLGDPATALGLGGGLRITSGLDLGTSPLSATVDLGHALLPGDQLTLALTTAGAGVELGFDVSPTFRVGGGATAGAYFGSLSGASAGSDSNLWAAAHVGADFRLTPALALGLKGSFNYYGALMSTVGAAASFSVRPDAGAGTLERPERTRPVPLLRPRPQPLGQASADSSEGGGSLEVVSVEFTQVFPVFFKYYDANPIGSAVVRNTGDGPIDEVSVSFFVDKYMDNPKSNTVTGSLAPGEEIEVPVTVLMHGVPVSSAASEPIVFGLIVNWSTQPHCADR